MPTGSDPKAGLAGRRFVYLKLRHTGNKRYRGYGPITTPMYASLLVLLDFYLDIDTGW